MREGERELRARAMSLTIDIISQITKSFEVVVQISQ